ncbi:hypothetical protein MRX96_005232 [Rhipicephalus microplus]
MHLFTDAERPLRSISRAGVHLTQRTARIIWPKIKGQGSPRGADPERRRDLLGGMRGVRVRSRPGVINRPFIRQRDPQRSWTPEMRAYSACYVLNRPPLIGTWHEAAYQINTFALIHP